MKLKQLYESSVKIDTTLVVKAAIKAGKQLFDKTSSGFIFGSEKVSVVPFDDFVKHETYDTMQFVFDPTTGIGVDVADTKISKDHAHDGVIYVADAERGVLLIPLSVKIEIEKDSKKLTLPEWKKKILLKYPDAEFEDKRNRIDAKLGSKHAGFWYTNDEDGEIYSTPRRVF